MFWDYVKYPRDVAIYAICPRCGFKHNPSFYNWATGRATIVRQFNYCPICGEYLRDPILFTRGNTKVINYETKEIELIETSESNEYE